MRHSQSTVRPVEETGPDPTPDEPAGGRLVLKIGTSSLVTDGELDPVKVDRLVEAVTAGLIAGLAPVLVTSGAIAIGRARHRMLAGGGSAAQQVAAALGQATLYGTLEAEFAAVGLRTGQLLLTPHELVEPGRGGGVRDTLDTMRALGFIPVVNENDALGVRNNDVLAALLSGYLGADLLLLLTDVPGLYDGDPRLGTATRVRRVASLGPEVERLAGGASGNGGTGGMRMKLSACWIATYAGVRAVIADTTDPGVLVDAWRDGEVGTTFSPRRGTGRPDLGRLWRAFRTPPEGSITLDEQGRSDVCRGRALTPARVSAWSGACRAGDVVDLLGPDGRLLARGSIGRDAAAPEPAGPSDAVLLSESDYVLITEDQPCQ